MRKLAIILLILVISSPVLGQSSSIGKQFADSRPDKPTRETPTATGNTVIEKTSLIAVKEREPKKFKVNDLITIIVRETTKYEADAKSDAKRQADFSSELDAFVKLTGSGIGAAAFRRGKPNIDFKADVNKKNDAETEREDKLTTRVTAVIIDVKPNGNLVFEARKQVAHDDEVHLTKLTGTCRGVDVTPDNSVLSTQIADLKIDITTKGSLRNATRSGWLAPIYDWIRPL